MHPADNASRAIRLQHQAEGEAQRKKEEAIAERKRKADEEAEWEATRDSRVAGKIKAHLPIQMNHLPLTDHWFHSGWRTFQKGGKKKKKDSNVLG